MRFWKGLVAGGGMFLSLAFAATSHAQTVVFNAVGSSAQFLELGQAAVSTGSGLSPAPTCLWTSKTAVVATDGSTHGGGATDTGSAWVAWNPGTAGNNSTCNTVGSTTQVYGFLQTDSVVGVRCLSNGCTVANSGGGATTANLIYPTGTTAGTTENSTLPTAVAAAFSTSVPVNVAATDIRPEDALFAITRATTACGTAIDQYTGSTPGSATQYLGLGYSNGDSIHSFYSSSSFHVIQFSLPSSYTVTPVGASPIVVAVSSTDASGTGFNSSNITNLNRASLALFLDGSIGETEDALKPGSTATTKPTTVLIREPLSGTYNTMEYNVPNSVELQTSQDVGSAQPSSTVNCSGAVPKWNTESTSMGTLVSGAVRNRVIGTGQMIAELFGTSGDTAPENGLGYAFWSQANFAPAASSLSAVKYLTVDGVDPILTSYSNGTIPTTTTELNNVTFANVTNGTYPIWSLLRLVTTGSGATTAAQNLAKAVGSFAISNHDWIPYFTSTGAVNLHVERAHFTPPGLYSSTAAPAPQNGFCGLVSGKTEAGGDVGGVVIPCQVDANYEADTGIGNGFTGTISGGHGVPTSLRRQ